MRTRSLIGAAVVATLLALPRSGAAQQPTAEVVLEQLLTRCPGLIDAGAAGVSEAIPTSEGFDAYFDYDPAASGCQVGLQAGVDSALSVLSARLATAPDWSLMSPDRWRGPRHLLIVDRYEEDGVPGASVGLVLIDGPLGAAALAQHARARRSLLEVARKAVFEICPILDYEQLDEAQALVEAEPELFRGGRAADPMEGQIILQKSGGLCSLYLQGPKAVEAVTGVLDEAESRGYVIDAEGRFHAPDFVLFARELSDQDPPLFEIHLVERDAYEAAITR